ncbi:MAG TPA: SdrD B-like domain-containing protein [Vicinamibacterales bacterium]
MSRTRTVAARVRRSSGAWLFLAAMVFPPSVLGQDQSAQVIQVFLNQPVTIPDAAASQVLILDETVCQVTIDAGLLKITGLRRGETLVLVWRNEEPQSLLVHVESPSPPPQEAGPTPEELDSIGHGSIGTVVHVARNSANGPSVTMVTPFAWTEGSTLRRFTMNGQLQQARTGGSSNRAVDALSAEWVRGKTTLTILDFTTSLDGGPLARITPSTRMNVFSLRGADVIVRGSGKNSYELFAGATLPWFNASRQLAGFTVTRQQSDRTFVDFTTAGVSVPVPADATRVARRSSVFQTIGLTDRVNDRASVQMRAGAGTTGLYGQLATSWQSERVSGFARATGSSPNFGLNQLQLLYAPRVDLQSGANWNVTSRLSTGVGYTHTETEATPLFPASGSSDYVSSTINLAVTQAHTLFANTVWNRNLGGLGTPGQLRGRRLDTGLGSRLGRYVRNDFQFSVGALADPLQLASRGQFTVRDTLGLTTRRGGINVSFVHDRLNPSLVARLHEQLNLLAPGLQSLFLDDPVGFVESPQMTPELRRLLASLEPLDTQVVVTGQFNLGSRLAVSPTMSYQHTASSSALRTNSSALGYGLIWHMTPTFDVTSSLSNNLIFDPRQRTLTRTTIFAAGLRKTWSGGPRWITPSAGYRVTGRVFRDLNLNGIDDQRDVGVPRVVVRLGPRTTLTDERGRFEFAGLSAGEYRLQVPLDQFGPGVRVTTAVDPVLRLYQHRLTEVNVGVVNFSRLVGTVFNDYALDGIRQGDAPGLRQIAVVISGDDGERRLVTDAAGDFEISDIAPGHYRLSIDSATLPGNYKSPAVPVEVDLRPSSTLTVSLPVYALRSIEGHVYVRMANNGERAGRADVEKALRPLKGVKVAAHGTIVQTDDTGRFVLRDLPAGDLFVSVVPNGVIPPDLHPPVGRLRMPMEPTQVENATIIIDNPRLLEYLADRVDTTSK